MTRPHDNQVDPEHVLFEDDTPQVDCNQDTVTCQTPFNITTQTRSRFSLRLLSGESAGRDFPMEGRRYVIGRARKCDLTPASSQVSRYHCAIEIDDGRLFLRDLNSTNGTFLNGQRLQGKRMERVYPGDRIRLGGFEFEIRVS